MELLLKTRECKCPCAYLFSNGNAAFFNHLENQIPEFQIHGWKGLHLFVELYPEALVYMQSADPFQPDILQYLLKNIIDPRISKDEK